MLAFGIEVAKVHIEETSPHLPQQQHRVGSGRRGMMRVEGKSSRPRESGRQLHEIPNRAEQSEFRVLERQAQPSRPAMPVELEHDIHQRTPPVCDRVIVPNWTLPDDRTGADRTGSFDGHIEITPATQLSLVRTKGKASGVEMHPDDLDTDARATWPHSRKTASVYWRWCQATARHGVMAKGGVTRKAQAALLWR